MRIKKRLNQQEKYMKNRENDFFFKQKYFLKFEKKFNKKNKISLLFFFFKQLIWF